jgi:exoribonuclease-2
MDPAELLTIARDATRARGLEPDFPAAATAEAATLASPAPIAGPGLQDLRDLPWCSIDNDDSRDLDQLTVAQPAGDGAVRVLVAIADVDALVHSGGAIDDHAPRNTTSVYTDAGSLPMLPLRLSNDLTSLNEGVHRAAVVAEVEVDRGGIASGLRVWRAVVRNHAQLAYGSVAEWLDGKAPPPSKVAAVGGLDEQLRLQDRAGQLLKEARRQRGALGLETPEARPVFNSDGVLADLRAETGNRAKDLIAGFMIAANGVTARFLDRRGYPSLRWFLLEPQRWQRIVEIAASHGGRLPPQPSAPALDAFLSQGRAAVPEAFEELSLTIVKLLGSVECMLSRPGEQAPGHFGLAVSDYTHSTAPNRRYPDLLTQRLVKAAPADAPPPLSDADLTALARHCTEQEDNAARAERQVLKSAAVLLLAPRIGQRFDAIVTGVSAQATSVRIVHPVAEGRVVQGYEGLDVGDRARVELIAVDAVLGHIGFRRSAG